LTDTITNTMYRLKFFADTDDLHWEDLRKIFRGRQWMAKIPNGVEKLQKISTA